MAKVSDVVVDALIQAGAKRCWGIVGDTINHFTDSLRKSDLQWMHVRHEEVGGLAAGGEAYFTGELAVCAGTCGPGTLHFVNGLFESHRNGAPVVLIATDVARAETGFGFPQELDQRKIYEQYSVFCDYISHPDQARRIVVQAAQAALTRGGLAVVIVNGDMFEEDTKDALPWAVHRPKSRLVPVDAELDELAKRLNAARTVTLYAGIGARDAKPQLIALARKLSAPIAHTSRSKEFIEPDNDHNIGMIGILGNKAGVEAVDAADVMLCLGTDFAYTQFYPGPEKIIQIDCDPTHIGRRAPVGLGLVGDVGPTIEALLDRLDQKSDTAHLDGARKQWAKDLEGYVHEAHESDSALIHPQFVAHTLDRLAADDAIFLSDGGSPMVWLLRHLTAKGNRRFLASLLHGTMANAYPQAMGAVAAYPDRQVVALSGDGGMTMLMGDLLTLKQEKLPVKILVFNNGSLGFVEMEQRVEGLLDAYTNLENPDFGKLAEACGLKGWRVEDAKDLESAMTEWLAADGPAILDVRVSSVELVMPPKIEAGQVASTALFGVKAVLDGRVREVVSLLRDNFLR